MLYADDGLVTARSGRYDRLLLLHMSLFQVLGTPMKWEKVRGGVQTEWVGYLSDRGRFELGISESRAACDKAAERRVPLGELP